MFRKRTLIKFGTSIVVLLLLISTSSLFVHSAEGSLANSSWPKFRGDLRNTGRNEDADQEVSNETIWTFDTEEKIDSSPTIAPDGTVYIGSKVVEEEGTLHAIGPNGAEKWAFRTDDTISSVPTVSGDGTIYFGTNGGKFYSLNPDGTQNWMIDDPFKTEIISSPVIRDDGSILIGSRDLYSFHPDGSMQWNWNYSDEDIGRIVSTPAVDGDGNIYFGYHSIVKQRGGGMVHRGELIALNSEGHEIWKFIIPDLNTQVLSSPAVSEDGNIYFGSYDNKLYALDDDGSKLWEYETGDQIFSSPAIGLDGTIYFGSNDNNLYALNPNGSEKWHFETGGKVYSSPAIGPDGMIYFGSFDNHTYSLNPDGTERWRIETGDSVFSSPALGPEGDLYIGSLDQKVYAIGEKRGQSILYQLGLPIVFVLGFLIAMLPKESKERKSS